MALSRKFLKGLSLTDEQVDAIIEAHDDSITALKKQRDEYKADAEKLSDVQRELNELKASQNDPDEWQKKYEKEHADFEAYKSDQTAKEEKQAKETAYKNALKDAGVSDKHIKLILKATNLDDISLDKEGKLKDADKVAENIKTEYADYITQQQQQGANTKNPPDNGGGGTMTKKSIMEIKDTAARQKAIAENPQLFGIGE